MKYTDFRNKSEVIEKFNLDFSTEDFIKEIPFNIEPIIKNRILKSFNKPGIFNSEYATCEAIIYPIISEVSEANNLPIWSHFRLSVPELKLSGEPDYLFALSKKGNDEFKLPIVCVGEAKKDDFIAGWAQVSAEMVASHNLNGQKDIPIYGLVTTGKFWEFAVFKNNTFIAHTTSFSTPSNLDQVLNILNWIFIESYKNAITLDNRKK